VLRWIFLFHQLLQGVHALHNAKPFPLLHRDRKLSNIGVVSYDDYSIVVVIGQTIQAQPHKPIGGKAGTRGYQAPEMPHQIHDPALDIWSCGIIGLRMFVQSGRFLPTPFKQISTKEWEY
jgi:serine/threonine protein kinase